MDLTRREFLVIAAAAPVVAALPVTIALAAPPPPPPPADPYRFDELPLSGLAGDCSGTLFS